MLHFGYKAGHHVCKATANKIKPKLKSRYKLSLIYRLILTMMHRRKIDPLSVRTIFLASYKSHVKVRKVNLLFTLNDIVISNTKQRIFIPASIPEILRHVTYTEFRITKYDTWLTSSSESPNKTCDLHLVLDHQIRHVTYFRFRITKYDTWLTSSSGSPKKTRDLHLVLDHQIRHMAYIQFRITQEDTWLTPSSGSPNTTRDLHPVPDHQIWHVTYFQFRVTK